MSSPAETLAAVVGKSRLIEQVLLRQRRRHKRRELGGSYNEACGLAQLQHERRTLQAKLPPLRVVGGSRF